MAFKLGDKVEWSSQANGGRTTKTGVVEQVVPAERSPMISSSGMPRNHESYVVAVEVGKRVKRKKLYWPRTSALKLAN